MSVATQRSSAERTGGLYVVVIDLRCDLTLRVGALGERSLTAGWYVYVGSARRGLRARVARHRRREERLRWHIDYLTTQAECEVVEAVELIDAGIDECALCRALRDGLSATVPIRRFGASDCAGGCGAHLLHVSERPDHHRIQALAAAGAGAPRCRPLS